MPGSIWRMNGFWKGMAGVLLLCALLLSNEVMCQDPATSTTNATDPDNSDVQPRDNATVAPAADATVPTAAAGDQSAASVAPGNSLSPSINVNTAVDAFNQEGGTSRTTAAPSAGRNDGTVGPRSNVQDVVVRTVLPDVQCVGKEDIPESNAVKAVVSTDDCEATKRIIQENPAGWCQQEKCNIKIYQEDNMLQVASDDADLDALAGTLQSEHLKDKLGVEMIETSSQSSGSSVFVGILVTGLLAAVAITVGYFRCQRKSDTKGLRLAEEAYPVDQENQGNTLVSEAPLNPPQETQEKPSVNGESPEAPKTEPPPTNGQSTTKTADTEL
ncbi:hypothetical protein PAMA_021358 [Pampus argenteus]